MKKGVYVQVAAAKLGKGSLSWKGKLMSPRAFSSFLKGIWGISAKLEGPRQRALLCRHRQLGLSKQQLEVGGDQELCSGVGRGGGVRPACALPAQRMWISSS